MNFLYDRPTDPRCAATSSRVCAGSRERERPESVQSVSALGKERFRNPRGPRKTIFGDEWSLVIIACERIRTLVVVIKNEFQVPVRPPRYKSLIFVGVRDNFRKFEAFKSSFGGGCSSARKRRPSGGGWRANKVQLTRK